MSLSITAGREYSGETFKGLEYGAVNIAGTQFLNCAFVRCRFHGTRLKDCRFHDCVFRDCDLNLVEVDGSAFRDVSFEQSKVMGINWTQAAWREAGFLNSIAFTDCVLNYSTFIGLELHGLRISGCVARDVDFAEADLIGADFKNTDFTSSRFLHTNLSQADFTGAYNYAIDASINTLSKAKFALPEARALLYSLDIILVEDEDSHQ